MKSSVLCAFIVLPCMAAAETIIIEYPDHFYAESVGTPERSSNSGVSRKGTTPPAEEPYAAVHQIDEAPPPSEAMPGTDFDAPPPVVGAAERRIEMKRMIQKLQWEQAEMLKPRPGETPDQAELRQKQAYGKLRRIKKISSELLRMPSD